MSENIDKIAEKINKAQDEINSSKEKELEKTEETNKVFSIRDIDQVFGELFLTEPFLGGVAAGITKVIDTKQPTAYVGVRPNGKTHEVIMGINPHFLLQYKDNQKKGVVKHELFHIILQHIFERSIGEKSYAVLWNWATDLAINSMIGEKNLPDLCLIPGKRPMDPKTGKPVEGKYAEYLANAPLGKASDHYFEGLRKIQDELGDSDGSIAIGSGIGTMDGHEDWKNVPDEVMDQIRDKVRDLIEKGAIRAQQSNNWGSVPSEMSDYIKKMLSKQVDWRSILRNFIGRTRTQERNSTIRKINKKMPYIHPGVKRPLKAKFAAFIDQSGSMTDDDIALMFGELKNLSNLTEIDVYHFDTEVDEKSHMVWKRTDANPKCLRTRCGGTDFQSVVNFCNRHDNKGKWSGVIILTDGYAPKCGQIFGSKVIWVITETGTLETVRSGDLAIQMKKEQVNAVPKPY